MTQTNIEMFDEIALAILSHLYGHFPIPVAIDPESLGLSDEKGRENSQGQTVFSTERLKLDEFCRNTAKWLAEEGYLSERRASGRAYTLSSAGLKALKHVPQPELGAETLGEKIKGASTGAIKLTASKLMDQFLAVAAPLAISTAGL